MAARGLLIASVFMLSACANVDKWLEAEQACRECYASNGELIYSFPADVVDYSLEDCRDLFNDFLKVDWRISRKLKSLEKGDPEEYLELKTIRDSLILDMEEYVK
jgi:hypothetical protein